MNDRTITVLVVTGDDAVRQTFADSLDSETYTFVFAGAHDQAMDALANRDIQLAVIDLSDPVIDGDGLLRRIRQQDVTDDVPIIGTRLPVGLRQHPQCTPGHARRHRAESRRRQDKPDFGTEKQLLRALAWARGRRRRAERPRTSAGCLAGCVGQSAAD